MERVGAVAYLLNLPENACIHVIILIGLLKQFDDTPHASKPSLPP
jgi:hypothetical protein